MQNKTQPKFSAGSHSWRYGLNAWQHAEDLVGESAGWPEKNSLLVAL